MDWGPCGGPACGSVPILSRPRRRARDSHEGHVYAGSLGALTMPPGAPFPKESRGQHRQHSPGHRSPVATPGSALTACPLQPLLSLNNSVTMRFADTGDVRVTVQAACGKSVLQDSKVIRVLGESPGWRAPSTAPASVRGRRPRDRGSAEMPLRNGCPGICAQWGGGTLLGDITAENDS